MKRQFGFVAFVIVGFSLFANAAAPKVHTVAGAYVGDGKPATSTALSFPGAAATDRHGNLYIADEYHCRLRKVNVHGIISTIAGTGICGFSGDGGPAKKAQIRPGGIAIDSHGTIFFTDGNNRVRMISASKTITTVAGNGTFGYCGDGGPAIDACLYLSLAVAVEEDESGETLYIADALNNRVRKVVLATGVITTVAGNGTAGYSGDGGQAVAASLNQPEGVAVDPQSHSLWISDSDNDAIRRVDTGTGVITTFFTGSCGWSSLFCSPQAISADGNGNLHAALLGSVAEIAVPSGVATIEAGNGGQGFSGDGSPATSALLNGPKGAVVDKSGDLLIADSGNNRIRKVDPSGTISTIVGGYVGDGDKSLQSSINSPRGLTFDKAGNLYIAETFGNRVRMITPAGAISTIAGTGLSGNTGDGGKATEADLNQPSSLAIDGSGNIFVGDLGDFSIRKIDSAGIISTFAQAVSPGALVADGSGNVYTQQQCTLVKISPAGQSTVVAGVTNQCGYNGDGIPANQAQIEELNGLTFDAAGNLYFSDYARVRMIDQHGLIHTVVGDGRCTFSGDGGPATKAQVCGPWGLSFDSKGNLYIADAFNLRIRVVNSSGVINTYAGNWDAGYNGNGLPALDTAMMPYPLAINSKGILYYGDVSNSLVRKIH